MEGMKQYPDNHFDVAIVDPPYGIGINVNMGRRKGYKKSSYHKFHGEDKQIPSSEYFTQLFRVSKNQIVWGGNYMTEYLKPSPCWVMWDKGFSEDVTFAQFELAWTSFSSSCKKYDKTSNQQNRIHPTQKPVALYRWLLDKYTNEGDLILDTHLGSGSIAIACHYMKRNLIGYEIDQKYYEAALKRFKQQTSQLTLL